MKRLILAFLLTALPALAESPMTASEFEAHTKGKTLYYGLGGERYGVEEYLPDRRVRWSFLDGECKDGAWYPSGEQICFVYEDNPVPQCWLFYLDGDRLAARFASGDDPTILYEVEGKGEMLCLGPKVGV
ncbi:MAG: hypothetical protein GYB25_07715 [Rhodobacteraceae bacterium]|nr:hypothetical protein [Paracoccaceae bacterium]